MKLANRSGRAVLVLADGVADVAEASDGRFGPDPMDCYERWDEFSEWAATISTATAPLDEETLANPVPLPRQIFAVGLNYGAHARETGMTAPERPAVFTKFLSSLTGPFDDVRLVGDTTDWEVELVVVVGRRCDHVEAADAWSHVAGLTVGQDLSDRTLQFAAGNQFSLGKSRTGYGPIGPWVVSVDEFDDPDDLALRCTVGDTLEQDARTSDLIFDVPSLVEELSAVTVLLPGDVVFTGTPAGVGVAKKPPQYLEPGDVVESWIEGIGTIRNTMVA